MWEEYSYIATVLSVVVSIATFVIAILANKNLARISKYTVRQADRKPVEDLVGLYDEAMKAYFRNKPFSEYGSGVILIAALNKAKLYGLNDIERHLQMIYDLQLKGEESYYTLFDDSGERADTYSREEVKNYYTLHRQMRDLFGDRNCFKKYLKVESHDL